MSDAERPSVSSTTSSHISAAFDPHANHSRRRLYGMCVVITLSFLLIAHLTNDDDWIQLWMPLTGMAMLLLSMSAAEFHLYVERLGVERQKEVEHQQHVEDNAADRQRIFNQLWQDLADQRGEPALPPHVLADLSSLFSANLTAFWMSEDAESRFRLRGAHHLETADYERLDKIGQVAPCFEKLQEKHRQLRVTDFRKQTAPALAWFCSDQGFSKGVFSPVMVRQEVVGVLAFFYKENPQLTSKQVEEMQSAANLFLCAVPPRNVN